MQPFPATRATYPVVPGGPSILVPHDGSELFYNLFRLENPRILDRGAKRLLGVTDATGSAASGEAATQQQIEVIFNWFTDLRTKVPN